MSLFSETGRERMVHWILLKNQTADKIDFYVMQEVDQAAHNLLFYLLKSFFIQTKGQQYWGGSSTITKHV